MTELMIRCTAASTPEVALLATAWLGLRARLDAALDDQRGMTTETVIITAGLAALAVAVVAIIASRVRNRARAIP